MRYSLLRMMENLKKLPSVDLVISTPDIKPILRRYRREIVIDVVRTVLESWRRKITILQADVERQEILRSICSDVQALCLEWERPSLRQVINGTGIILHTGLGRAPLAANAVDSLLRSTSYSSFSQF